MFSYLRHDRGVHWDGVVAGAVGVAVEIGALGVRSEVRRGLRENGPFKQRFRYLCPEYVLANVQFLKHKIAQNDVCLPQWRAGSRAGSG